MSRDKRYLIGVDVYVVSTSRSLACPLFGKFCFKISRTHVFLPFHLFFLLFFFCQLQYTYSTTNTFKRFSLLILLLWRVCFYVKDNQLFTHFSRVIHYSCVCDSSKIVYNILASICSYIRQLLCSMQFFLLYIFYHVAR